MSSFINKSTRKVAPRLPAPRRRPADASARVSTEPQASLVPERSQSIQAPQAPQAPQAQQQDALPTPPPTQPSNSESSSAGAEAPSTIRLPLQTPSINQGELREDRSSAAQPSLSPRAEPEGHDEPSSKRRRVTPPRVEIAEKSTDVATQNGAILQPDEPPEPLAESTRARRPLQPDSRHRPGSHQTLDTAAGVQIADYAVPDVLPAVEDQRENVTSQAGIQQDSAANREASGMKRPVRSKPRIPIPPASPPLGGTIMRTIEGPEEPIPPPRPRKVRKDKGTKRKNKHQTAEPDNNAIHENAPAVLSEGDVNALGQTSAATTFRIRPGDINVSEERSGGSSAPATIPSLPTNGSRIPKPQSRTAQSSFTPAASIEAGITLGGLARPRKRRRRKTPAENEHVEITPSITTMHDLCKDTRTGQTSTKEKRLQARDLAEAERKQNAAQGRLRSFSSVTQSAQNLSAGASDNVHRENGHGSGSLTATNHDEADNEGIVHHGPTLRLVDGIIQVDETSLQVDRHAAQNDDLDSATAPIEEDDLSQRLNAQSWLYANRRDPADRLPNSHKGDPWDPDQTRLFYEALRMFGTDFEIISAMFPGRNRRQIKSKFTREERENPELVEEALGIEGRVPMNLEQYAQATGRDAADEDEDREEGGEGRGFVDPIKLREELAREEEEAKKQIEELKKGAAEEMRQREAAKLHRSGDRGDGERDATGIRGNGGDKKRQKKRKEKSDRKSGKGAKPAVVTGREEVVVESVEA